MLKAIIAASCVALFTSPLIAQCPGDCDRSGTVEFSDLVAMLFAFGGGGVPDCDTDQSGSVSFTDLTMTLTSFGPCPEVTPITMDGSFEDWDVIAPAATDPLGDASGAFDLTRVSVTSRGENVYMRFDTNNVRNIQAGSGSDGTLILRVTGPTGTYFELDMRNRQFSINGEKDLLEPTHHTDIAYFTMPTYADDEFEMSMNVNAIGAYAGDEIVIEFSGADSLDAPITHELRLPEDPPFAQPIARAPGTDLRVINLNVLQRGLLDPARAPGLRNLLSSIDADVFCLQEMWNGTPQEIRSVMAAAFAGETDGRQDPANWNVAIENGAAMATTLPLQVMSVPGNRESGGIVTLPSGRRVFVLSIHLKCCGSIGSSEDIQRINSTNAYANYFANLIANEPGLGVVISGDWNLVGSRTPLDIIVTNGAIGMEALEMLQAGDRRTTTWRDAGSSFTPGRLDLIAFTRDAFANANGFVLDTARLPQSTLGPLGLNATDSANSDHLMLVADFIMSD